MLLSRKIWIIESKEEEWKTYDSALSQDNCNLSFFQNFEQFTTAYSKEPQSSQPDIIIADIDHQNSNAFIKLSSSEPAISSPFIIISESKDLSTMRQSFEAGAVDYLMKPLIPDELQAKTEKHLIERQRKLEETSKSLEALNIDVSAFTNKEIKIIESFNIRDEKTLHRSEIVKLIWKNINIHPNTLDVHIYNLRKKLKAYGYGIKSSGNGIFKFIDIS